MAIDPIAAAALVALTLSQTGAITFVKFERLISKTKEGGYVLSEKGKSHQHLLERCAALFQMKTTKLIEYIQKHKEASCAEKIEIVWDQGKPVMDCVERIVTSRQMQYLFSMYREAEELTGLISEI